MPDTPSPIRNWSDSLETRPAALARPTSVEEVVEIVRDRARYPSPLRPMGSYHSTTACAVADGGTLVDMRGLDRVLEITETHVRAEAGAEYIDVAEALRARGLEFHVALEIGNITLGSAACCATKDGSYPGEAGQAGAFVSAVRMVDAEGELVEIGEDQPELFQALRSSYGLMGVIVEVTFRVRRAKPIAVVHRNYSTQAFLDALPELRASEGSLAFYIFPFADRITAQLRGPAKARAWRNPFVWRVRNFGVAYAVPLFVRALALVPGRGLRLAVMRAFDAMSRLLLALTLRARSTRASDQITRYRYRPKLACFTFNIWAFPEQDYPDILRAYQTFCRAHLEAHGYRPELLTVGYRVSPSQHALLSYSFEGPVLTIDPVGFAGPDWDRFNAAFNIFCHSHGGKPLLNQSPALTPEQVEAAFGERLAQQRAAVRERDPSGRFTNPHFARLLRLD